MKQINMQDLQLSYSNILDSECSHLPEGMTLKQELVLDDATQHSKKDFCSHTLISCRSNNEKWPMFAKRYENRLREGRLVQVALPSFSKKQKIQILRNWPKRDIELCSLNRPPRLESSV